MNEKYFPYNIEDGICDMCHSEYVDGELELIVTMNGMRDKSGSIKKEFSDEWTKLYEGRHLIRKCFVYVSDCGCDRITLCVDHLIEALGKLFNVSAEEIMKTHIRFYCNVCNEFIEGRFQPEDESGTILLIRCENCHTVVGEYITGD